METVGKCQLTKKGDFSFVKAFLNQGWVYKNYNNFYEKNNLPCYVPELSRGYGKHIDGVSDYYTYEDFLSIANGDETLAEELFLDVDWQSPETLKEEWDCIIADVSSWINN